MGKTVNQQYLSSIKVTKYTAPSLDRTGSGPATSVCTRSRRPWARIAETRGIGVRCILPTMHASQTGEDELLAEICMATLQTVHVCGPSSASFTLALCFLLSKWALRLSAEFRYTPQSLHLNLSCFRRAAYFLLDSRRTAISQAARSTRSCKDSCAREGRRWRLRDEACACGAGGGEDSGGGAVKSKMFSSCPGGKNAGSSKTKSGSGVGGVEAARKVGGESSEASSTR